MKINKETIRGFFKKKGLIPLIIKYAVCIVMAAILIVGTNIGGLGTPIASMASLISFKIATASGMVGKARYLAVFAAWNAAFLVALCVANAVFGWA